MCCVWCRLVRTNFDLFRLLRRRPHDVCHRLGDRRGERALREVLLIAVAPTSRLHAFSFLAQFAYLIFFRTCDHVGLPTPPAHTNAVMMIMTIKLIGVALEIAESRKTAIGEDDAEKQRYRSVDPGPIDIFHYVFCHAGVLTGTF